MEQEMSTSFNTGRKTIIRLFTAVGTFLTAGCVGVVPGEAYYPRGYYPSSGYYVTPRVTVTYPRPPIYAYPQAPVYRAPPVRQGHHHYHR